jgi:hypothetical protein
MAEDHDDPTLRIAILRVITELLFTILPFVIVAIVLSFRGTISHVVYIPEWAIAATVLEGLVLVKFISVFFIIVKLEQTAEMMSWGAFIFAILLMICFVPTVLVLVFVFLETEISGKLAVLQVIAFVVAVLVFFVCSLMLEGANFAETDRAAKAAKK